MPRLRIFLLIIIFFSSLTQPLATAANPKYGEPCKRAGIEKTYKSITYVCLKVKKKLVWTGKQASGSSSGSDQAKKVLVPSTSTPTPTGFQDLYQNRTGVSYGAWLKTSKIINSSSPRIPKFEVFVGPQTKPWYENLEYIFGLVSQAFPKAKLPDKVSIYFYNYKDLDWAQTQVKEALSPADYSDLNSTENGHLVDSNCQPEVEDCLGSKQITTRFGNDLALLLIGVSKHPGMYKSGNKLFGDAGLEESNLGGMLIAHEYFHAFQRETLLGKNLNQNDWPPPWVIEGSATFIQNASVYNQSFTKYFNWRDKSMGDLYKVSGVTETFIADFMDLSHYKDNWSGFNKDWNYQLGSRIIEALVAIKGPESIIEFHDQMSKKIGLENAFKNVYGISYSDAIPIIAKTVAANFNGRN